MPTSNFKDTKKLHDYINKNWPIVVSSKWSVDCKWSVLIIPTCSWELSWIAKDTAQRDQVEGF